MIYKKLRKNACDEKRAKSGKMKFLVPRPGWLYLLGAATFALIGISCAPRDGGPPSESYESAPRPPRIDPDYGGTVIPPNIAPLNFLVEEPGVEYRIEISSARGESMEISSARAQIEIPPAPWKELLAANRGEEIRFDIYVRDEKGRWQRFETLISKVAVDEIDPYLAYRLLKPLYNKYVNMGIYQRHLQSYEEAVVIHNKTADHACINCHTFPDNRTDDMLLHIRGLHGQRMLMYRQGKISNIDTRTAFNPAPASFTTWHPSRQAVVFTTPEASIFFHTVGETREVFYAASDLALYRIEDNILTTTADISRPDYLDVFPTWSPDGAHLYFCSAPKMPPERFRDVQCDLVRISYDAESDTWGALETVLAAKDTGLSISAPRISPDGRFLVFCMSEYGIFPVFYASSDLYLMDLHRGTYERLDINSDQSESWHSWSSNSRWMVFSSKRRDGLFAKPYFTYIDAEGKAHKPFVLPQKDPQFYHSFTKTYNVPELIREPVQATSQDLARAIYAPREVLQAQLDPRVQVRQRNAADTPPDPYDSGGRQ